jgi:hypothetical protein
MEQSMTTRKTWGIEDLKQIVDDLKEGEAREDIKTACIASQTCLERIRNNRAKREHVNEAVRPEPEKRRINARLFLSAFRAASDDYRLMREFSLSPKQLKTIYKALVQKGLLSEYEYFYRQTKAPELDEPTDAVLSASTVVSLVEGLSDETRRMYGVKTRDDKHPANDTADAKKQPALRPPDGDRCPNCGKPKGRSGTCERCGIVFSKFARKSIPCGIPVWDFDVRDR